MPSGVVVTKALEGYIMDRMFVRHRLGSAGRNISEIRMFGECGME